MRRWKNGVAIAFLLVTPLLRATSQVQQQGASALPAGYAGSAACTECHRKEAAQFKQSTMGKVLVSAKQPREDHGKLGCETCHGPSKQHANTGAEERGGLISFSRKSPSPVKERNAVCLSCHEKNQRVLWKGSMHETRDVACTDCHTIMHTESETANLRKESVVQTCGRCHAQQKAQQTRFAHMPLGEGKLECTSCHNPHGTANPKMLLASSTNETCYSCHAEKRGPYLWEHPPVVENCATCHDPHGSNHEKMLNVSRPRLCQQCHGGATQHPSGPKNPNLATDIQYVYNRECNNCHTQIHGSNHPSGKFFTR